MSRNSPISETDLIRRTIEAIQDRLPERWTAELQSSQQRVGRRRIDALIQIRDPDGKEGWLVVEAKRRINPKDIPTLVAELRETTPDRPAAPLLVAPFLGQWAQEKITDQEASYADATGNLRVVLARPAVFIQTMGAQRNPWPDQQVLGSLRGRAASRAARALCDFQPPFGIRDLARWSKTPAPTLSRVAALLEREGIVSRKTLRGRILSVDWQGLLRRWSQDYSVMESNRVLTFLEPRGLKTLLQKLRTSSTPYAVTGSLAARSVAAIAEPRLAIVYARDAKALGIELILRAAETGANVVLAEPFDSVVFDRTVRSKGIVYAAYSQVAVDLLTGPGRNPAEGEELLGWMTRNEKKWRQRVNMS